MTKKYHQISSGAHFCLKVASIQGLAKVHEIGNDFERRPPTAILFFAEKRGSRVLRGFRVMELAPQVRLELTTLRLTAECSAIELLRKTRPMQPPVKSAGREAFL